MPCLCHRENAESSLAGGKRWLLHIGLKPIQCSNPKCFLLKVLSSFVLMTTGLFVKCAIDSGELEVIRAVREDEAHDTDSKVHQSVDGE